jgi:hypothetical protein
VQTYTDRFLSSLIALISIFLLPMMAAAVPSLKKEWGSLMQDSEVAFEVMGRYESVPIDMGGRNWRPMRHEGSVSMVSLATMRSIKWNEC